MPTSSNASRPLLDATRTCRDPHGENGQFAGTASQRLTDRLVPLNCDCGCHRLNLDRYPADPGVNLNGTEYGGGLAVLSFTPKIGTPRPPEKKLAVPGHLRRCGSSHCCKSHRKPNIVTSKNECGSFPNLANLFVHVDRHNHPRSAHSTRYFLGSGRGCNCQK